jgi:hypothetical protein
MTIQVTTWRAVTERSLLGRYNAAALQLYEKEIYDTGATASCDHFFNYWTGLHKESMLGCCNAATLQVYERE